MPVAYPPSLPLALLAKTREQPAAFSMAEPRRGWGYVEPTGTDVPVFWPLTWRFTAAQAQLFRNWFVYSLARGTLSFSMTIRTEFGAIEHDDLQFLPDGLLPAKQIGADLWEYSATVMARSEVISDFPLVVALITGNGADGSSSITDQSSFARTTTLTGTVTLEDSQFKFGPTSIRFDSAGTERITIAADADAALGTADATIEFFYRGDSATSAYGLVSNDRFNAAGGIQISTEFNGTDAVNGRIRVALNDGPTLIRSANGTAAAATWHFVQLRRSGSTWTLYVDGVLGGTATADFEVFDRWILGVEASSGSFGNYLNGHIEQFRVTRGLVRPTTVPIAAFPTA